MLEPRDHQLLAALGACFGRRSFMKSTEGWKDLDGRSGIPALRGDWESFRKLITAGKIEASERDGKTLYRTKSS